MPAAKGAPYRLVGIYPAAPKAKTATACFRCGVVAKPALAEGRKAWCSEACYGGDFRVVWVDNGRRLSERFETYAKAKRGAMAKLDGILEKESITVGAAMDLYEIHKRSEQVRPRTILNLRNRLRAVFGQKPDTLLGSLTATECRKLFDAYAQAPIWWTVLKGREPRLPAVYALKKIRDEARRFFDWCRSEGHLQSPVNPWTFAIKGAPSRGKPQLQFGQIADFEAAALHRANAGNSGALAACIAFYTGARSAEILSRRVSDLHAIRDQRMPDGFVHVLLIDDDRYAAGRFALKTTQSRRPIPLPHHLWLLVERHVQGLAPHSHLFGSDVRPERPFGHRWLNKAIVAICKAAKIDGVVSAHGLRGTRASENMRLGERLGDIALLLGNSPAILASNYVAPGAAPAVKSPTFSEN